MSSSAYLTPPVTQRPLVKRLHSLQSPRTHPYCQAPPLSPSSPLLSPAHGGPSCSPFHPVSAPSTPAAGYPKRPGAPKRAHSFCASSANSSYALASTSAASHLSQNKRDLVAPPLERTLSSFGSAGNMSPPEYRMERPRRVPLGPLDINDSMLLSNAISPLPTPPSSPLPRIIVSSSSTPPRPSLKPHQSPTACSSRSTSYNTIIATPTSPRPTLFGMIEEDDEHEPLTESPTKMGNGPYTPSEEMALQHVASNLGRMAV